MNDNFFNQAERRKRLRNHAGDWHGFRCGDLVYDEGDERHIGRIESIWSSTLATIRWRETGWTSVIPLSRLRKQEQGQ